jgi:hypothetical protein
MTRIDYQQAHELAISLLRLAGFEFSHDSRISETCYFIHPARRPLLIRVSTHRSKKSPIGLNQVIARLTFTAKDTTHLNEKLVAKRVTWAIGEYFMAAPKQSRYQCKRGTRVDADDCEEKP